MTQCSFANVAVIFLITKRVDGNKVINLKTSRDICTLYGETAQVGSRKLLKCFYSIFNTDILPFVSVSF